MEQEIAILFLACVGCGYCIGGPKGQESNEWLLKVSSTDFNAKNFAEQYGLYVIAKPLPGYYVVNESSLLSPRSGPVSVRRDDILAEPKIESIKRLKYLNLHTRQTISVSDASWGDMWYINPSHGGTGQSPSMQVYEVWQAGVTGAGVHVQLLDDGVEPAHTDLAPNYVSQYSYDYIGDQSAVSHTGYDSHGTMCSGIIAAAKNTECVLGIAHGSTFSAVKILNNYYALTDYGSSLAVQHALSQTDVYSNSWGPADNGYIFDGPETLTQAAFKNAVETGRGGKGAIFLWANGNGGSYDDCNCDGYANSIYTIAVTSLGRNREPADFSESCSSVFVATYGGSSGDLKIATTDVENSCTTDFIGTSAACPVAAGIVALVLEARSELTWRDVQHLIVETATTQDILNADWLTNAAGKLVSHKVGFGLMDASAMVERARNWTLVPAQLKCESPLMSVSMVSESAMSVGDCDIGFLEHVQVLITFGSEDRGATEIVLTSPQGTQSKLLHSRVFDSFDGDTEWTFMTVMSWGENPVGQWTLRLDGSAYIDYDIKSWRIIQYGTTGDPLHYGTTGDPPYGTTKDPQYGTTGDTQYGTTEDPQYGTTGDTQYGTTGDTQYGTTGDTQYGTTGDTQYGTTGDTQYGTTGDTQYGTTGDPQYGTTGEQQYGTTGDTQYGTTGDTQYGTTGDTQYGTTRDPQYGTTGDPQYGTTGDPQYGTTGDTQYGTTGDTQYGTTRDPQYGTTGDPQYGTTGDPQYGTTGHPLNGVAPEDDSGGVNVGAIVGGVIGAVVLSAGVAAVGYFLAHKAPTAAVSP